MTIPHSENTQSNLKQLSDSHSSFSGYLHIRTSKALGINEEMPLVWSRMTDNGWTPLEMTPWRQLTMGGIRLAGVITAIGISALALALGFWRACTGSGCRKCGGARLSRQSVRHDQADRAGGSNGHSCPYRG